MKTILIMTGLLLTSAAFAGPVSTMDAAKTGAEVILRQIADSNHFGLDGLRAVRAALSGSASGSRSAYVRSMSCEPALDGKSCTIALSVTDSSRPAGFQDLSFDIEANIYQGYVISGGPVKVEL